MPDHKLSTFDAADAGKFNHSPTRSFQYPSKCSNTVVNKAVVPMKANCLPGFLLLAAALVIGYRNIASSRSSADIHGKIGTSTGRADLRFTKSFTAPSPQFKVRDRTKADRVTDRFPDDGAVNPVEKERLLQAMSDWNAIE